MIRNYNGIHYDNRFREFDADLDFWKEQARRFGDPILEIGFGTGRVGLVLAREGYRITGLELEVSMLDRAREKIKEENLPVEVFQGDMRGFNLGQYFPLVILPFNGLAHLLTFRDLMDTLRAVERHLSPGGRFVFDYLNPNLEILSRDPNRWYPSSEYFDESGRKVVVREKSYYNAQSQVNRVTMEYSCETGEVSEDDIWMRMFFPCELEALLALNGWEIEGRFGNYSRAPFNSESPKQLIICSPRRKK